MVVSDERLADGVKLTERLVGRRAPPHGVA
jgi:hypothetical protein